MRALQCGDAKSKVMVCQVRAREHSGPSVRLIEDVLQPRDEGLAFNRLPLLPEALGLGKGVEGGEVNNPTIAGASSAIGMAGGFIQSIGITAFTFALRANHDSLFPQPLRRGLAVGEAGVPCGYCVAFSDSIRGIKAGSAYAFAANHLGNHAASEVTFVATKRTRQ